MIEYDRGWEFPTELTNALSVEDTDGSVVVYKARAYNLKFDGLDIRGRASLEKWRETTAAIVPAKRRFNFRQFRFQEIPESKQRQSTRLWFVQAVEGLPYFLASGRPVDPSRPAGYKIDLIGNAANGGIIITGKLIEDAFGPIDQEVWRLYTIIEKAAEARFRIAS